MDRAAMKSPCNKPHALNPAKTLWFQFEYHWRGVSDAKRSTNISYAKTFQFP